MGLFTSVFYLVGLKEPVFYGILTCLILSIGLKNIVAISHRQGMRLVKQQKFAEAIPFFEESVDFFTRRRWIDKYRYCLLLSFSKMTYREMGLCNIAFCYGQLGNGQNAKKFYEQALVEYPSNGLAKAGLNMIKSIKQS